LKEDLPIDFDYYLNKQLKPPILRIMEHVIPNPEGLFKGDHTNSRYIAKINSNSGLGKFLKV
jgi:DNA polymerase delta subunit 1